MHFLSKRLARPRHLWLLLLSAVFLLCLPRLLSGLRFSYFIKEGEWGKILTFTYTTDRSVTCYVAGEGREDNGDAYVFLPSFADTGELLVETTANRVTFEAADGEEIEVCSGEEKLCAFVQDDTYTLRIYGTGAQPLLEKKLTFLKSGNLPTLYVSTVSGSMEQLDADKDYKESGSAELLDADGERILAAELKSISARGNQTFGYEKKSYHIRLGKAAELLGMEESDSWILLSNVYDVSYIRNKLSYDMALQAGMEGSAQSEYIDVYFNGEYGGMYLLCEKVELGENRLELRDLEEENEKLNGNLDNAYRWQSEDGTLKGVDVTQNPEDISGGYLIEHDYTDKYTAEISGFILDSGEEFVVQSPEHASKEQVAYVGDLFQRIENAIKAEDGCDPETGTHYTELIDLTSWADKFLVEEISRNNAGGMTSSYFYKYDDSVSTKVFGGPVWDFDKAWGRVRGFCQNTRNLGYLTYHSDRSTLWFYYLRKQPEFMEMVKKEYAEKFSDYLGVMAEEKIDEYAAQIEASSKLDRMRFLHVYGSYGEDTDTQAKQEYIRQFIEERKAFLDEVWLEDAELCEVRLMTQSGRLANCIAVIKGEAIGVRPWYVNDKPVNWKIEGTEEYLARDTVITEDLVAWAVWAEETEETEE